MISVTSLKSYSVQHDVHFIHFVPTWSKINDKEVTTICFLSQIHPLLIMSGFKISDVTEKCSTSKRGLHKAVGDVTVFTVTFKILWLHLIVSTLCMYTSPLASLPTSQF